MNRNDAAEDALSHLKVAKRCPANWKEMSGSDKVRFCNRCALHVYNISGMDRKDAAELIQKSEGKVCVRYFVRPDGQVMTADCPRATRIRVRASAVFSSLLAVFGLYLFAPVTIMGATMPSPETRLRNAMRELKMYDEMAKEAPDPEDKATLNEEETKLRKRIKALAIKIRDNG